MSNTLYFFMIIVYSWLSYRNCISIPFSRVE